MMRYLNIVHNLRLEELKIADGDRSKRLGQEILEQHWTQRPEGATVDMPFWAKADGVVKEIIIQELIRERNDRLASMSPSISPPYTPSSLYDNPVNGSPSVKDITTTSTDTSMGLEPTDRALHNLCHHGTTPPSGDAQSDLQTSYGEELMTKSCEGNLKERHSKTTTKPARWRPSKDAKITKASGKFARGSRDSKVLQAELRC